MNENAVLEGPPLHPYPNIESGWRLRVPAAPGQAGTLTLSLASHSGGGWGNHHSIQNSLRHSPWPRAAAPRPRLSSENPEARCHILITIHSPSTGSSVWRKQWHLDNYFKVWGRRLCRHVSMNINHSLTFTQTFHHSISASVCIKVF